MPLMPKIMAAAVTLAFALAGASAAFSQGVAPGGGIANTTGIGNGLGPPGGTGPHYPNGTGQPTLLPPPPPGGGSSAPARPPVISTVRPPSYPEPHDPFGSPTSNSSAASPLLRLPEQPANDLSFLKGCWRTDVFQYAPAHQPGVATYCFDDKGVGKLLYRRLNQPSYFCRGPVRADYAEKQLRIRNFETTCNDGDNGYPDNLDCRRSPNQTAQCSGNVVTPGGTDTWTVHLHWIPSRHAPPD